MFLSVGMAPETLGPVRGGAAGALCRRAHAGGSHRRSPVAGSFSLGRKVRGDCRGRGYLPSALAAPTRSVTVHPGRREGNASPRGLRDGASSSPAVVELGAWGRVAPAGALRHGGRLCPHAMERTPVVPRLPGPCPTAPPPCAVMQGVGRGDQHPHFEGTQGPGLRQGPMRRQAEE